MIPRIKESAKRKADKFCKILRDAGCQYHKRYSIMNKKSDLMKIKLFAIDCHFMEFAEKSGLFIEMNRLHIRYKFMDREYNGYTQSFVFWLPVKKDLKNL